MTTKIEKETMIAFLKEISEMLDRALDPNQTDAEESFDLLYEISDKLKKAGKQ